MKTLSEESGMKIPTDNRLVEEPLATGITLHAESMTVDINDGRSITVPFSWYPRLRDATLKERSNWRLIGIGRGIHWEDVDEDISLQSMLEGRVAWELVRERQAVTGAA